jgi:hypothetical protein
MALTIMALMVRYLETGSFLCFLIYIKLVKAQRIANTMENQLTEVLDTNPTNISDQSIVILTCK